MADTNNGGMWTVLGVIIIGTFITILNSSLINIALPKMMAIFGVSLDSIQWVVTAYTIALGAVIPLSGYLSDLLGAKKLYLGSLIVFTLGSLLCGMAWSNSSMIAFRVIQGIGGGIIGPVGNAIIFRTVPPEKRGIAMGLYGVAAMAAPAIGPTLGGYLIANLSWRMLFYISVPFGILGVMVGSLLLQEFPKKSPGNFDLIGFITSTIGLVCIFYVLGKWTSIDWREMEYPLLLALGVFSLILFIVNELMHPTPLLDLRLFKLYDFSAWSVVMCFLSMAMIAVPYLVPIFLQNIMGYSAMQTGMLLFPSAIATAIMMPISGKIFDRWGYRAVMIPGLFLFVAVSYPLSFLNTDTSAGTINLLLIIRGMAMGLVASPATTMAMNSVSKAMINQASALMNITRQVASTVSIALITTILQHRIALNSATISDQLSVTNPVTTDAVRALQGVYFQGGLSASDANGVAISTLAGLVQKQAYVDAIDYIFLLMMLVMAVLFVCIVFIDLPKYVRTRLQELHNKKEAVY
ncbi:DHA2 family efflux MFS transporter permease subunit [Desulforamulus aeronauticus]|uniref:Drug resistance transporter, EmrB/QacA subfamily n=1 Tax=Desulforamulus aeronauticus DSM 10349 TaxID=1121421 RepID=A0A1M6QDY6_9FIRM|nr:DHA2 family efflux MFS transporter permease subunit [Desulforamulus aeronauticus]SHK18273.1 drug resistance transporter, EmrB/QacA subfamily [Desulforamulus aeronauticus DSM 10349]